MSSGEGSCDCVERGRHSWDLKESYAFNENLSRYKLYITLRIRVGYSPFHFCGGELNIKESSIWNYKVIKLIVNLISNIKRKGIKNRRVPASRLTGPCVVAPRITRVPAYSSHEAFVL